MSALPMGLLKEPSLPMAAIQQVSNLLTDLAIKLQRLSVSACKIMWKIGKENPRRVVHALKVGLALMLVSSLYLLEPLYEGIGQNAMWAVMTVVVVLEYTAGATLCKGLNRGFGTLCAGLLAFAIEVMAKKSRKTFRAVSIGASVFIVGFAATYLRFIPNIKKNYDYGVMIFLLTFNLIMVSSYRVKDILGLAQSRLYTIAIGCSVCLIMSLLILPNWSGEDLHNSTVYKLESLARSIRACVEEYFQDTDVEITEDRTPTDVIDKDYRTVLDSKSSDETLAQFASWEPRCTRSFRKYPWKRYVTLGALLRHAGYTAVALHGCLNSQIEAPKSVRTLFREPCTRVAKEVSKVLTELASSIKNRRLFSSDTLRDRLHDALQELNSAIKSQPRLFLGSKSSNKLKVDWKSEKSAKAMPTVISLSSFKSDVSSLSEWSKRAAYSSTQKQLRTTSSKISISSLEFSEALPFAAFSSLLVELVARLDLVIEEVDKLGKAAHFREFSGRDDVSIDLSNKERGANETGREPQNHHLESHADGF